MKLLIIDKKSQIKVENTLIKVDGKKIPFRLIETIILPNSFSLNNKDLLKITNNNITILVVSFYNYQSSIIYNPKSKNAHLKMEQYRALNNSLNIAKHILKNKISSHIKHLQKYNIELNFDFAKIDSCFSLDELLGLEGSFAREYFSNYFSLFPKPLHSGKRTKHPPLDPINALLSFYYTIYYNLITLKLISLGYEPSIGYLHKAFRSHNAFASDIIELIRADINEFVAKIFLEKILSAKDFSKKNGGVYLKYNSRKTLWPLFQEFNTTLDKKIDNKIKEIRELL